MFLSGVEAIANGPMRGFAGRDFQVNVGFGADGGADRPEVETGDRKAAGLFDAYSGTRVFNEEIVVGNIVRIAG